VLKRVLVTILILLGLLPAGVWFFGPALIAPRVNFEQGPGGAIAYISIAQQLRTQATALWNGKDISLKVTEPEFSGMLSSALLSGRTQHNPLRKVRAELRADQIRVESVLMVIDDRVPKRFQGPIGLELWVRPQMAAGAQVRFQITSAAIGRIPVPIRLIQWAGRTLQVDTPGFSASDAAITLPLGDMVGSQIGRKVELKQFSVQQAELTMMAAVSR
jgi:hypothetical protein